MTRYEGQILEAETEGVEMQKGVNSGDIIEVEVAVGAAVTTRMRCAWKKLEPILRRNKK